MVSLGMFRGQSGLDCLRKLLGAWYGSLAYLQVAVSDAKFRVGKPSGHIGMDLRINIGVDPDQDPSLLAHCFGSSRNILQVKLTVAIDQHALLNGKSQFLRELPITIEDRSAEKLHLMHQARIKFRKDYIPLQPSCIR